MIYFEHFIYFKFYFLLNQKFINQKYTDKSYLKVKKWNKNLFVFFLITVISVLIDNFSYSNQHGDWNSLRY